MKCPVTACPNTAGPRSISVASIVLMSIETGRSGKEKAKASGAGRLVAVVAGMRTNSIRPAVNVFTDKFPLNRAARFQSSTTSDSVNQTPASSATVNLSIFA